MTRLTKQTDGRTWHHYVPLKNKEVNAMQRSISGWIAVVVIGLIILVVVFLFWRTSKVTQETTPEVQKGQKAMPPGGRPPFPSTQIR